MVEDIKDDSAVMSEDKLMRDIQALLENKGAVIPDDDDDDDTVTEDNDGDGGGIRMESGPQQILLNGRDRDDIDEIVRGRNRSWSSEDEEEEEEQEQLLRKRSASSRKNVHFR